jgi:hypothetical protein
VKIQEELEKISNTLGLKEFGNISILELNREGDSSEIKDLKLVSGEWSSNSAFIVDKENHENISLMLPVEFMIKLLESVKGTIKDNFEIKMEKAILNEMPIDYNDVLTVVMHELDTKKERKDKSVDIDKVVQIVKKKHPNLFYEMNLRDIIDGDIN